MTSTTAPQTDQAGARQDDRLEQHGGWAENLMARQTVAKIVQNDVRWSVPGKSAYACSQRRYLTTTPLSGSPPPLPSPHPRVAMTSRLKALF